MRGFTYAFAVNAASHPFWIATSSASGNTNAYNTGVGNNGAATSTVLFKVPSAAPNTLYYNCEFHSGMTGTLTIIDGQCCLCALMSHSLTCYATTGPLYPFSLTNSGSTAYVINGTNNKALTIQASAAYAFLVNFPSHPFWINTVAGMILLAPLSHLGTVTALATLPHRHRHKQRLCWRHQQRRHHRHCVPDCTLQPHHPLLQLPVPPSHDRHHHCCCRSVLCAVV